LPLFERARVEVYLPDLPSLTYQDLREALTEEFTYTFGGCTLIQGLSGTYLLQLGLPVEDRINLLYTDAPFSLNRGFETLSNYADALRQAAFESLEEEAILVVMYSVDLSVPRDKLRKHRPDGLQNLAAIGLLTWTELGKVLIEASRTASREDERSYADRAVAWLRGRGHL
jgi:hypothetical protein